MLIPFPNNFEPLNFLISSIFNFRKLILAYSNSKLLIENVVPWVARRGKISRDGIPHFSKDSARGNSQFKNFIFELARSRIRKIFRDRGL